MGTIVSPSSSSAAAAPAKRRKAATNGVDGLLARLTKIRPGRHRVVSCYLKLEPRDRSRGKYLIKLKNRAKDLLSAAPTLGLSRDEIKALSGDLARVVDHLSQSAGLPNTHGIAIFACAGLDLFEVQPLPVVHRSRLAIDRTPLVKELAAMEDEVGRLLAVVTDRTQARFFEVTAFGCDEVTQLAAKESTRGGKFHGHTGLGEHTYHNRIREEKQRHAESVARELFALDRRQPVHGIVLGGVGGEPAMVRPFLHPYLAGRVMGPIKLAPKEATLATVHSATLEARSVWERGEEQALVRKVDEAMGNGWAVNGIGPTLRALARGQVRTLLVHGEASQPGFRSAASGRLALTERELRDEGPVEAVVDVVDDAIEEALRQHVDVNVVFDGQASGALAGMAALLRFR